MSKRGPGRGFPRDRTRGQITTPHSRVGGHQVILKIKACVAWNSTSGSLSFLNPPTLQMEKLRPWRRETCLRPLSLQRANETQLCLLIYNFWVLNNSRIYKRLALLDWCGSAAALRISVCAFPAHYHLMMDLGTIRASVP